VDVVYFLAAKLSLLLQLLVPNPLRSIRLFDFLLLMGMAASALAARTPLHRMLCFATPQVWYVFAYCNGDAFAYLLAFFISGLLLEIHAEAASPAEVRNRMPRFLVLGVLLGLLSLSKRNYYAYLTYLAPLGAWLVWVAAPAARRPLARGLAAAGLVALSIFGARWGLELGINGLDRQARLHAVHEEFAQPPYRLSAPVSESYPSMRLREKGVRPLELFTQHRLHELSWKSFVGLYGAMNLPSGGAYYAAMLALQLALAGLACAAALREGGRASAALLAVTAFGAAMALFLSFWRSWTFDFQAQGRYLFPILPMAAFFVGAHARLERWGPLHALVAAALALSLLSFTWYGLRAVPGGAW
jgi:hypothetical protein